MESRGNKPGYVKGTKGFDICVYIYVFMYMNACMCV